MYFLQTLGESLLIMIFTIFLIQGQLVAMLFCRVMMKIFKKEAKIVKI